MTNRTEALSLADRLDSSDPSFDDCTDAAAELRRLHKELERERMKLAACGIVARADTPDSAKNARKMHQDYESASCSDVALRVDECIRLRALNLGLIEALKPFAVYGREGSIDTEVGAAIAAIAKATGEQA